MPCKSLTAFLAAVLVTLASASFGADPVLVATNPNDVDAKIAAAEQRIVAAILKQLRQDSPAPPTGTIEERLAEVERKLGSLPQDLTPASWDSLNLRALANEQKLGTVSRRTPDGYDVPNILGSMDTSPDFRKEFVRAISGHVQVHNQMGSWMTVYVNGDRWRFPPGVSSIKTTYGPIRARLDGGEAHTLDNWKKSPEGENVLALRITNNVPLEN